MRKLYYFPDWKRVNPRREIRESATPARVVYDFTPTYLTNEKRRRFHEIMERVEIFSASGLIKIESIPDIHALLLSVMSEELKRLRYQMNYYTLNAMIFISNTVLRWLVEVSPKTFLAPDYDYRPGSENRHEEEVILAYVFSRERTGSSELSGFIEIAEQFYLNESDRIRKQYGDTKEDSEKTYYELAHIFALVIDIVKTYMLPFRQTHEQPIPLSANDERN